MDEEPVTHTIESGICPECGVEVADRPVHADWHERLKKAISLSGIGLGGLGL